MKKLTSFIAFITWIGAGAAKYLATKGYNISIVSTSRKEGELKNILEWWHLYNWTKHQG